MSRSLWRESHLQIVAGYARLVGFAPTTSKIITLDALLNELQALGGSVYLESIPADLRPKGRSRHTIP